MDCQLKGRRVNNVCTQEIRCNRRAEELDMEDVHICESPSRVAEIDN
jgi:hypothetical protein